MKIENAVALVTGSNRGIGRALVDELLSAGVRRVYAAARDPKQIAPRDRVVPVKLDVTDPRDVEALPEKVPGVNLLINNAGVFGATSLLGGTKELETDLATNVFGVLAVTKALVPTIEQAGGGAIANILSVVSFASMTGFGGYSATKAAAFSITQGLRAELRAKKIAVHAVFPGPVDTEMTRALAIPKASPESVARAIVAGVASGEEDILPDAMAREVFATWARDPKALERQFGAT